jgi:hypothetical protein
MRLQDGRRPDALIRERYKDKNPKHWTIADTE